MPVPRETGASNAVGLGTCEPNRVGLTPSHFPQETTMAHVEPMLVAARLRHLLGGATANLEAAAVDLAVSEVALRMSVDDLSPHPALEVIIAVVRHYGVDPTWLMTGEYNSAHHRAALEAEESATTAEIANLISNAVASGDPLGGHSESLPM
jgi:hypothetical protein